MAKIAVDLEQAVAQRVVSGGPGTMSSRVLGQGDGWHVADVVCTSGPHDRPFEEQHSCFTIAVVLAGTFQYRGALSHSRTAHELMTPGSLLLGSAGQYFECGHEHAWGDRCLSFRYTPDYFERLVAVAGLPRVLWNFKILRLPPLKSLSRTVARACAALVRSTDPNTHWEELSVQIAAEAAWLVQGLSTHPSSVPPSTVARVTRAVRMIERQAEGELPLGSLAQEAGLSPYHFLRTFQQLTGLTPHQYVRRIRLREAAVRLTSAREKILNIALDCGFGDVSNFNRAFRTEFGLSPRAYRWQTGRH